MRSRSICVLVLIALAMTPGMAQQERIYLGDWVVEFNLHTPYGYAIKPPIGPERDFGWTTWETDIGSAGFPSFPSPWWATIGISKHDEPLWGIGEETDSMVGVFEGLEIYPTPELRFDQQYQQRNVTIGGHPGFEIIGYGKIDGDVWTVTWMEVYLDQYTTYAVMGYGVPDNILTNFVNSNRIYHRGYIGEPLSWCFDTPCKLDRAWYTIMGSAPPIGANMIVKDGVIRCNPVKDPGEVKHYISLLSSTQDNNDDGTVQSDNSVWLDTPEGHYVYMQYGWGRLEIGFERRQVPSGATPTPITIPVGLARETEQPIDLWKLAPPGTTGEFKRRIIPVT